MQIGALIQRTSSYFAGDVRRINHFLKVFALAKTIGEGEGLDSRTQHILECAAVLHDIGIREAERRYHSAAGKYQEALGPEAAAEILKEFPIEEKDAARICYLIGHHHTYDSIDGSDYQSLVEADFLVNIGEDGIDEASIYTIKVKIFKTKTGKDLLRALYGV